MSDVRWSGRGDPGQRLAAQQTHVHAHNLRLVVQTLRRLERATRSQLATATGLTRMATGRLVATLIDLGMITAVEETSSGLAGRPAAILELDRGMTMVGVEVTADDITVVEMDLRGDLEMITRAPVASGLGPSDLATRIAAEIDGTVRSAREAHRRTVGAGIAVPAFVDRTRRRIVTSSSLDLHDVAMVSEVEQRLTEPVPVVMDSRANCRAIAQSSRREYTQHEVLAHLEVDATIGAGIVIDGRISRGARGYAGSVGHIPLDPRGPRCECGNSGCLEALAGLNRLAELAGIPGPSSRGRGVWRDEVLIAIRARADEGDRIVLDALEEVGHWLGVGCVAIIHALNPSMVTIGGYPTQLDRWLDDSIQTTAARMSLVAHRSECAIVIAAPDTTSVAQGAATLGLDTMLADPMRALKE